MRVEQHPRPQHARSVQPDPSHTVGHGRYLLFEWPAARPLSARALTYAVRPGGPTTFTSEPHAPTCSCHLWEVGNSSPEWRMARGTRVPVSREGAACHQAEVPRLVGVWSRLERDGHARALRPDRCCCVVAERVRPAATPGRARVYTASLALQAAAPSAPSWLCHLCRAAS